MGLDMYLMKAKRYKNANINDISKVNDYNEYLEQKDIGYSGTFKDWCGLDESEVDKELLSIYRIFPDQFWIYEVGYWRKANHIHNWFVEHVQDGEDDCQYHHEVTPELLRELRHLCLEILDTRVEIRIDECYDTLYDFDRQLADELLPTCPGFFFGSTAYDEFYLQNLEKTVEICDEILDSVDFEHEMVYYLSSW